MSAVCDPRGLRLGAAVTSVVLATVLLTDGALRLTLLGVQLAVFAAGAVLGPNRSPYGVIFRTLVRPRLGPPAEVEGAGPPRFAQAVGLVFSALALAGYLAGAPAVGSIATGLALVAALLNAVVGLCLGCEAYLLLRRLVPSGGRTNSDVGRSGLDLDDQKPTARSGRSTAARSGRSTAARSGHTTTEVIR